MNRLWEGYGNSERNSNGRDTPTAMLDQFGNLVTDWKDWKPALETYKRRLEKRKIKEEFLQQRKTKMNDAPDLSDKVLNIWKRMKQETNLLMQMRPFEQMVGISS